MEGINRRCVSKWFNGYMDRNINNLYNSDKF